MGFALWIDGELAWAQGVHEYRPMGAAVIGVTDRFRPRDFRFTRSSPSRAASTYVGLFASLGDLNGYLDGRSQASEKKLRGRSSPAPPWL
jgi:hypothetical protein